MKINKMVYAELTQEVIYNSKLSDFIHRTDYGTIEIMSDDIQNLENELTESQQATEDEYNPFVDVATVQKLKDELGTELYNALLNEDVDIAIIIEV